MDRKENDLIKWTCFNCNELISGKEHLCNYEDAWRQERYTCVDCGREGSLNSEMTYRGEDYICWPCNASDIHQGYRAKQANSLERIAEILELIASKL